MTKESLPPSSKQATPIADQDGNPVPGLFVFEVLHRDLQLEESIRKFLIEEKSSDVKPQS